MPVRPATAADVSAIRETARESWHAAYDEVVGQDAVDVQVDEWYAHEVVADAVAGDEWPYLVAEREDRVVGYASGGPTDEGPADGVVAAIYVRPDAWGAGTGSALLEALHDRLRSLGCASVWLAVLAANDVGRSFYADHGYERHEDRVGEIAGVEVDELVLTRSL